MNAAKLSRQINEGAALHQKGDLGNAERLYRDVLKSNPKQPDALHLLGVLVGQRGDNAKGIVLVRQALAVQSAFPDAHVNLARMLMATGELESARTHYERALTLKPNHAVAQNGLGFLYRALGASSEARAAFARAFRLEPRLMEAYINYCNVCRDAGDEAAIPAVATQGLAVDPQCAPLWLLRSEAAFTMGRLDDGWRDYEWRFRTSQNPVERPPYALPFWNGEDLSDKGILVWHEQSVGEDVLFSSMIPTLAAKARRCVVHTTDRLLPVFRRSFPNVEVYAGMVPADIVATLDVQSAAGSLGQWLRPTFRAFPARAGYLAAAPAHVAALRAKYISGAERRLLVGLAWRSAENVDTAASRHTIADAAQKSVGLNQWGAILSVPGVTFVNLQYGENREAIAAARAAFGAEIIEDSEVNALGDLDPYTAQVAAMDLVISSSNTAAHFAGAVGVPTFCMIPRVLGNGRRWYWFGNGRYSPWYGAMTLFRQRQTSLWTDVLTDIALALTGAAHAAGTLQDPAEYLDRLARGLISADMVHEAAAAYDSALAYPPLPGLRGAAQANQHGMLLARLGRFDDAVAAYERALAVAPDEAETHNNLGTAHRRAGRSRAASASYAKAHALKPEHPSIFLNNAMALSEIGDLAGSLGALDRLIALNPDYVDAQYNRAMVLMGLGRLREGWNAFKWRMKRTSVHVHHDNFPQPVWTGQDLKGKHLLVWTDTGLGEEILVAGIIPDLAAVARQVTLLCSERLLGLFRRSFPNITVARRAEPLPPEALAQDIDFQMSMAELGAAFRPDFAAFPAREKYLLPDVGLRDALRQKYQGGDSGRKLVGISWRSINPEIGAQKSIPLAAWASLLRTPGVTFVNLQYGDTTDEVAALKRDQGIDLLTDAAIDSLGDVDRVAAQVAAMDHVVSISNTAVHLCGALGVPVDVLLPPGHARLWYWFRGQEACAWYQHATLLAADTAGGWEAVMATAARHVQAL